MLYLLGVVGVAMRFGRVPAALAALLNVAAFDFVFVSPQLSFAVSDVQYLVTFGVMLGVGLLVGQLTAGLRFSAGGIGRAGAAHALAVRAHARALGGAGSFASGGHRRSGRAAAFRRAGRGAAVGRHRPPRGARRAARGLRSERGGLDSAPRSQRGPGDGHAGRAGLALRAAHGPHARARRARARARAAALAAHPRAGAAPGNPLRGKSPSRWSACITSRWRSVPCWTWSPSACATRCWAPSRTTCARRSPRSSPWRNRCRRNPMKPSPPHRRPSCSRPTSCTPWSATCWTWPGWRAASRAAACACGATGSRWKR